MSLVYYFNKTQVLTLQLTVLIHSTELLER
jgi:hypothetical protein